MSLFSNTNSVLNRVFNFGTGLKPESAEQKQRDTNSADSRYEFFHQVQDFISSRLDHFLQGKPHSYLMQTNSVRGQIVLRFDEKRNVPELSDIERFVDYLNVTAYLFDARNSDNSFSVHEQSKGNFVISYDGSVYGHDSERMRALAGELAQVAENNNEDEL